MRFVPLYFFASLVSVRQKPAEKRADTLVAAMPFGRRGREVGLRGLSKEQSFTTSYLRIGPGTLLLSAASPFAGRGKSQRSLVVGSNAEGRQNLLVPSDDPRVLESPQGGERIAHLHSKGATSFACMTRPMSLVSPKSHWVRLVRLVRFTESGLQVRRPASTRFSIRKMASVTHKRVQRMSCPEHR